MGRVKLPIDNEVLNNGMTYIELESKVNQHFEVWTKDVGFLVGSMANIIGFKNREFQESSDRHQKILSEVNGWE